MKKAVFAFLTLLSFFTINAWAEEEIIITGSPPPPITYTGSSLGSGSYSPYDGSYSGRSIAITQARKVCADYFAKQTVTDAKDCKAEVDYKADTMLDSCNDHSGALAWSFSYSGPSFSMSIDLAPVAYLASVSGANCRGAINNARALTLSKCETAGETVKNQSCKNIN